MMSYKASLLFSTVSWEPGVWCLRWKESPSLNCKWLHTENKPCTKCENNKQKKIGVFKINLALVQPFFILSHNISVCYLFSEFTAWWIWMRPFCIQEWSMVCNFQRKKVDIKLDVLKFYHLKFFLFTDRTRENYRDAICIVMKQLLRTSSPISSFWSLAWASSYQ